MIKRSCVVISLIISVVAFSGVDAFGQLLRRNNDNRVVRPAVRDSLKAEIILESNSSAQQEWKLAAVKGERPDRKVIEDPDVPGAPTVISWNFGEMSRSSVDRAAKFRFAFFDDDHEYSAEFTFFPKEGKIRFEYSPSIGLDWDFDKEASSNIAPTKKRISPAPRNIAGADEKDEWTLGSILGGKAEGTAVFKFNFRGEDYTEVKSRFESNTLVVSFFGTQGSFAF